MLVVIAMRAFWLVGVIGPTNWLITPPNATYSPDGQVGVATAVECFGTTIDLVPRDTNPNAGIASTPHAHTTARVTNNVNARPRRRRPLLVVALVPLNTVDPQNSSLRKE
jgi:hypothetical protein